MIVLFHIKIVYDVKLKSSNYYKVLFVVLSYFNIFWKTKKDKMQILLLILYNVYKTLAMISAKQAEDTKILVYNCFLKS